MRPSSPGYGTILQTLSWGPYPILTSRFGLSSLLAFSRLNRRRVPLYTVTRLLQRFLENENGWSVETIEKLIEGRTGLQDDDGRDAFAGRFGYLKKRSEEAREIFDGVLREVFHAEAGGTLHVVDIKGSYGEPGLKVAGAEKYFGLIFIGVWIRAAEIGAPSIRS